MFLFDLKWFIFSLLTLLLGLIYAIVWLGWLYQKRSNTIFFSHGKALQGILEQAPFGWLVVDRAGAYRYANAYTRQLLDLSTPAGPSLARCNLGDIIRRRLLADASYRGFYRAVSSRGFAL
jgi:hypothetical protein